MEKFSVKDLLYINKMITPSIITIIYWVLGVVTVLLVLVAGIGFMVGGMALRGLLVIILGGPLALIVLRVYVELLIVIFRINNNLQKLVDKEEK
jgi:hypothetical protein